MLIENIRNVCTVCFLLLLLAGFLYLMPSQSFQGITADALVPLLKECSDAEDILCLLEHFLQGYCVA